MLEDEKERGGVETAGTDGTAVLECCCVFEVSPIVFERLRLKKLNGVFEGLGNALPDGSTMTLGATDGVAEPAFDGRKLGDDARARTDDMNDNVRLF